jgi:hypothetical protein
MDVSDGNRAKPATIILQFAKMQPPEAAKLAVSRNFSGFSTNPTALQAQ